MKAYERLVKVLEEEAECYEKMREEKRKEQRCILERDYAALDENVARVEKICWHLGNLEKQRETAVADISITLGKEKFPKEMTVTDIAKEVDDSSSLRNISDKLSGLLEEVQTLNQENSHLLSGSLDTVSEVLYALLSEINETNVAYTDRGVRSAGFAQAGLINQKA